MRVKRFCCLVAALLYGVAAVPVSAEVVVIDSTARSSTSTGVQTVGAGEPEELVGADGEGVSVGSGNSDTPTSNITSLGSPATAESSNSTLHLLNLLDELRQELMLQRGLVEELSYQVKQVQQDSRERYVELDSRLSMLGSDSLGGAGRSGSDTSTDDEPVASEERAYQQAFALVKEKEYAKAVSAFDRLLADYPNGTFVDNALYWLGDVQMARGRIQDAKSEFERLLEKHPGSPKVPDAIYKMARIYQLEDNRSEAKKWLEMLISQYPGTTAARLADTQLRKL